MTYEYSLHFFLKSRKGQSVGYSNIQLNIIYRIFPSLEFPKGGFRMDLKNEYIQRIIACSGYFKEVLTKKDYLTEYYNFMIHKDLNSFKDIKEIEIQVSKDKRIKNGVECCGLNHETILVNPAILVKKFDARKARPALMKIIQAVES